MTRPTATAVTPFVRRLVLGAALFLGLAFALAPRTPSVHAQQPQPAAPAAESGKAPASKTVTVSTGRGVEAKIEVGESSDPAAKAASSATGAAQTEDVPKADPGSAASRGHNVTIGKHGRVTVNGLGTDGEFDSFGDFAHNEPAIAAMVIAIVSVVFFAPVLAIGLILWYRFRKARMLNETMVKLAERGIVPSAEAIDALAAGSRGSRVTVVRETAPAAGVVAAAAAAPEQTTRIVIGRRSAWSDLRKGVIMSGIGLALAFYSMLEDREPNAIGLILLFVGIGFIVLWWFEERRFAPSDAAARVGSPPPGGNGSPPSPV